MNDRIARLEAESRNQQIELAILRAEMTAENGVLPGTLFVPAARKFGPEDLQSKVIDRFL